MPARVMVGRSEQFRTGFASANDPQFGAYGAYRSVRPGQFRQTRYATVVGPATAAGSTDLSRFDHERTLRILSGLSALSCLLR